MELSCGCSRVEDAPTDIWRLRSVLVGCGSGRGAPLDLERRASRNVLKGSRQSGSVQRRLTGEIYRFPMLTLCQVAFFAASVRLLALQIVVHLLDVCQMD